MAHFIHDAIYFGIGVLCGALAVARYVRSQHAGDPQ